MSKLNLNQYPWFDDYKEEKKFYRILFRPGRAVQARELNQIQSLIHKQIERFGNHVFESGTQVLPGSKNGVKYINNTGFIKISLTENLNANLENKTKFDTYWKDKVLTNSVTSSNPGIKAIVIGYRAADANNEVRLYLDYVKSSDDGQRQEFIKNEGLKIEENNIVASVANHNYAIGKISSVIVENSVYYFDGSFILVDRQRHFIVPESSIASDGVTTLDPDGASPESQALWLKNPTANVGLKIVESEINYEDAKDGPSILDNALGTPNYSAPGADRLRITAELGQMSLNDVDTRFISVLRVVDGVVQFRTTNTDYSVLEDTLARRTYDESGDYTVTSFIAEIKDFFNDGTNNGAHSLEEFKFKNQSDALKVAMDKFNLSGLPQNITHTVGGFYYPGENQTHLKQLGEDRLSVKIDPGKAYVKGYEIEKISTTIVDFQKARTFHFENNIDVKTPLGTFFYVRGLGGIPTILQEINLYSQVLTSSGSSSVVPEGPNSANKIGTGKISAIEFFSGTPGDKKLGIYRLFLFDINIDEGKDIADVKSFFTETGTTFGCNCALSEYRLTGSVGVSIAGLITGVGTSWRNDETQRVKKGDYVQVGTGESAKLFRIKSNPANDNELEIDGKDVSSFVASDISTITAGATISLMYTVAQSNSTNPGFVYTLPDNYVYTLRSGAQDLINDNQIDTRYVVRGSTLITAGALTTLTYSLTGETESFESFSTTAYSVVSPQGDWLEVKPLSGTTPTPAVGTAEVDPSGKTLRVYINSADKGAAGSAGQFFVTYSVVKGAGATSVANSKERTKTLVKGYFNAVSKKYATDGYKVSPNNNVTELSLDKADVLRITRILAGDNPSDTEILNASDKDVTALYILDDGQRDSYYDIAKIVLRPGFQAPTGKLRVEFDYFQHGATGDYFSADSYVFRGTSPQLSYDEIPEYVGSDGLKYSLASCIDFRPVFRLNASGQKVLNTTSALPKDTFLCDYHRYQGRIDKLYLDRSGKFIIKQGKPDVAPQAPDDPETGMVVYEFNVAPYTSGPQAVFSKMRDNKRYTMRDIGKLENRIKNLEYYTTLSMLEANTKGLAIKDAAGQDKFKNGFLVDNFSDYKSSDLGSGDWKAALDTGGQTARPLVHTAAIRLSDSLGSGTDKTTLAARAAKNHQKTGDLYTLPYTHVLLKNQSLASKVISVNPYSVFTFVGKLKMYPWSDEWREINNLAPLNVKDEAQFQASKAQFGPTGTTIDYQQTSNNWTGIKHEEEKLKGKAGQNLVVAGHAWLDKLSPKERAEARRTKTMRVPEGYANAGEMVPASGGRGYISKVNRTTNTMTGDAITTTMTSTFKDLGFSNPMDLGSRVVSTDLAEHIRSRYILFEARTFKPTTQLYAFFDGVNISAHCGTLTKAQYDAALPLVDNLINPIVALLPFPTNNKNLITDNSGTLYGFFKIPNNPAGTRFRTGDRIFRLTTSFNNSKSPVPESAGEANYTARGWIENKQQTTLSTRLFHIAKNTTTTSADITMELPPTDEPEPPTPADPIAQSFFVHEKEGCFLTKVDLYFFKKPTVSIAGGALPAIELEIRPLDAGGYPSNIIMPFGRVILDSDEVTTNHVDMTTRKLTINGPKHNNVEVPSITADNFVPTSFVFESPIYLSPLQSYCICLISQSTTEYKVWIAQYGPDSTSRDAQDSFVEEGTMNTEIGTSTQISTPCFIDGTFFKSENSLSWVADPTADMKFDVYKAKFDIAVNGEIEFINEELPLENLTLDPIQVKSGSNRIRVMHPAHGHYSYGTTNGSTVIFTPLLDQKIKIVAGNNHQTLTADVTTMPTDLTPNVFVMNPLTNEIRQVDTVNSVTKTIGLKNAFSDLIGVTEIRYCKKEYTSTTFKGIDPRVLFFAAPPTDPNKPLGHPVVKAELDYYVVELTELSGVTGATANVTGKIGGDNIFVSNNKRFQEMMVLTTPLTTPGTNIDWNVETVTGKGVNDAVNTPRQLLPRVNIQPNELLVFNRSMQVCSIIEERKLNRAEGVKGTLNVRAVLSSTSENISPVIDKSRMSANLISNRLNNPYGQIQEGLTDTSEEVLNDEFDVTQIVPSVDDEVPTTANLIYFVQSSTERSGTVNVTSGSRKVSGTGTSFFSEFKVGDKIRISNTNEERTVTALTKASADGATPEEITVDTPFTLSTTTTGSKYYSNISNMKIKTANAAVAKQLKKIHVGKYCMLELKNPTSGTTITGSNRTFGSINSTSKTIQNGCKVLNVTYTPNNTVVDDQLDGPKLMEIEFDYRTSSASGFEATNITVVTQADRFVDEIAPEGGSIGAKYVSKKLVVSRPSNALKVMFDGNRHNSCEFEIYYKLEPVNSSVDMDNIKWVKAEFNLELDGVYKNITPEPNNGVNEFSAYEATILGLPSFVGAQVKIAMRGGNPAKPPKIMNFRMIILDE